MSGGVDGGVAERYESFLRQYPTGRLTVAVGFVSVAGLAWLARRTRGRPVRLVIGNCQRRRFSRASDEDRRVAVAFLDRRDVDVRNWYRRNPVVREAHLKAWMIEAEGGPVALVGSANLTGAGLFRNWELVVEARGADREQAVRELRALWGEAWDQLDRVREYVAGDLEWPVPEPEEPEGRRRLPRLWDGVEPGCVGFWLVVLAGVGLLLWVFVASVMNLLRGLAQWLGF